MYQALSRPPQEPGYDTRRGHTQYGKGASTQGKMNARVTVTEVVDSVFGFSRSKELEWHQVIAFLRN